MNDEKYKKITTILSTLGVIIASIGLAYVVYDHLYLKTSPPIISQNNSTNQNKSNNNNMNINGSVDNSTFANGGNIIINNNYNGNMPTPVQNQTSTLAPTPQTKLQIYNNSIGMSFSLLPAGSFIMGNDNYYNELAGTYEESPAHTVDIVYQFYMSKYEVTEKQWIEIMGRNSDHYYRGDNYPIDNITFRQMLEFINKLNNKEKTTKYRLPTEAEWEYACKANTSTTFYFGDDESKLMNYAWYRINSKATLHTVGQKLPNDWDLYDMLGNAYDAVADVWHENYGVISGEAPSDGSAWGKEDGSYGITVRGGGIDCTPEYLRDTSRGQIPVFDPQQIVPNVGFRLVKEV